MAVMPKFSPIVFLLVATLLEVTGDAVVRKGLAHDSSWARTGIFGLGACFLFGYGLFLNLAPLEFGRVVGLYIATLFVMWQVVSFIAFRSVPSLPILVGGAFIIAGGAIVSFWKP